jgi:putative flippase GtrA
MATTPAMVLDRLTGGRGAKAARYTAVSGVAVVITQSSLAILHGLLGVGPVLSNLLAVSISAVPAFILNKRWVWGKGGRAHVRREVLPFWGFTLLGLGISSGFVLASRSIAEGTLVVMLANFAGFGVVWVAKFLFLDAVIFGERGHEQAGGEVVVSG